MITIIWGPPGSGKTRNAAFLKGKYGCKRVIDEYMGVQEPRDGDLLLCQQEPLIKSTNTRVIHIAEALRK